MFPRFSQSQAHSLSGHQKPLDLFWPARRSSCLTRAVRLVGWLKCF